MSVDPHITRAFKGYGGGPVREWVGAHRASPTPFAGRPLGLVNTDATPVAEPLPAIVDVTEAPAPEPTEPAPTPLAVVRASLAAAVIALDQLEQYGIDS